MHNMNASLVLDPTETFRFFMDEVFFIGRNRRYPKNVAGIWKNIEMLAMVGASEIFGLI